MILHKKQGDGIVALTISSTPKLAAVVRGGEDGDQLPNKYRTGLAQTVDHVQAYDRDSQLERWATSRDSGQPCELQLTFRCVKNSLQLTGLDGSICSRTQSNKSTLRYIA